MTPSEWSKEYRKAVGLQKQYATKSLRAKERGDTKGEERWQKLADEQIEVIRDLLEKKP